MKLTKNQKEKIKKIGSKYNLKLMIIHGSFAIGRERPGSDLDIAILGKKPIDFNTLGEIFGDLEEVFGNSPERELDIKTLDNVDALFLYQVMKDSILIYGSSFDYWQLKTYAIRNYWDHKPILNLEKILIRKYLKKYA
jgi:predicted nucleotidyltransferase